MLTNTTTTSTDTSTISNRFDQLSVVREYENDDFMTQNQNNNHDSGINYTNLPPLENNLPQPAQRQIATTTKPSTSATSVLQPIKSTGAIKKIPENLKLRSDDKINNNTDESSVYRASGPYIPLSDCFSGSPVLFVRILFITL